MRLSIVLLVHLLDRLPSIHILSHIIVLFYGYRCKSIFADCFTRYSMST